MTAVHQRLSRFALLLCALCSTPAPAGITAFWRHVPISAEAIAEVPRLAEKQTWDLMVFTDGNWASAGLNASMSPGNSWFRHPLGNGFRPHPALVANNPALAYSTYITAPSDNGITGAPANLGGFPEGQPPNFGDSGPYFTLSWGDLVNDPPGTYPILRWTYPRGVAPNVMNNTPIPVANPSNTSQVSPDSTTSIPDPPARRVNWRNDADGQWHVPANWDTNSLPESTDSVALDVGGAVVRTVTHSQGGTTIQSLDSRERFVLSGGRLEIITVAELSGPFEIAGGTLINALVTGSPLTVTSGGGTVRGVRLNSGINLLPAGTIEVENGLMLNGVVDFGAGSTMRFAGAQTLFGNATITLGNASRVLLETSATLTIARGITIDGGRGATIGFANGNPILNNQARITANVTGSVLTINSFRFFNSGTLEARDGATLNINTYSFTSSGQVVARAGSSVNVNGFITTTSGSVGGVGAVRASGLDVQGVVGKTGNGPLRLNWIILPPGTALDLFAGSVVVDHPDVFPIVRARIVSGYNGGDWDGSGITSTTAADDPEHSLGVGYARAGQLFSTFPATFAGESITQPGTTLVRLVRYGDANLDGLVDLRDFNRLAGGFGSSGAMWDDGDFNYDGDVNLADFNLLAANFGQSAAAAGAVTPADWANLAAAVPEPGWACALMLTAPLPLARRRRSSRRSILS